ncbi:MAG: MarR family winged helix-turn-helix transcriptional regulator [Chloroflexota bacterium]|nr:MarR family winged helix-turn-helix transcriptional regulator [Chloroflexota bacterium]
MTVSLESGNLDLRLWFMIHRTHEMLKMCEDRVFGEYKLTTEQYIVLVTTKYLGGPVRPSDVARWLGRSPNSISMMVDRMVKAGLLRRLRDRKDRREVRLVITSKGETALKPATLAGWEFIQKILSQVSYDDRHTLMRLLNTLQYETANYLNPGRDMEEIRRNEAKSHDNLMERLVQYTSLSIPEAKRQGGKKKKAIR